MFSLRIDRLYKRQGISLAFPPAQAVTKQLGHRLQKYKNDQESSGQIMIMFIFSNNHFLVSLYHSGTGLIVSTFPLCMTFMIQTIPIITIREVHENRGIEFQGPEAALSKQILSIGPGKR